MGCLHECSLMLIVGEKAYVPCPATQVMGARPLLYIDIYLECIGGCSLLESPHPHHCVLVCLLLSLTLTLLACVLHNPPFNWYQSKVHVWCALARVCGGAATLSLELGYGGEGLICRCLWSTCYLYKKSVVCA